jgi:serine/threonine protein kinase
MRQTINNRFVVIQKIGEGGMGSVFLVYDLAIEEICALKLIREGIT